MKTKLVLIKEGGLLSESHESVESAMDSAVDSLRYGWAVPTRIENDEITLFYTDIRAEQQKRAHDSAGV